MKLPTSLYSEPVIRLDHSGGRSLERQLVEQLRSAIIQGRIPPDSRLPSSRELARECGVSRNLVVSAYDELFVEGYIEGVHGSGTYVRRDLQSMLPDIQRRPIRTQPEATRSIEPTDVIDLRIDVGGVEPMPQTVWRQIWRGVANQIPPNRYMDPEGDYPLRAAISRYLHRARGVRCEPEEVMITSGSQHAIDLLVRSTVGPGQVTAMEEPGYPRVRRVFIQSGATLAPIPVDADGLCVDLLPAGRRAPVLVYVTPSHQFPLGSRLSIARRLALLEWAANTGSLVVEDDYDSEFRYGAPPLPALAALDPGDSVAYVGSFSKILSPALRIGYLVAPASTRERIREIRSLSDWHSSWPLQRALAVFIDSGAFDTYIRRMRRLYGLKRAALARLLDEAPEVGTLRGIDAGLHAFWELAPGISASETAAMAAEQGVRVSTAQEFYAGVPVVSGVGMGYGAIDHARLKYAAETLIAAARRQR